MADALIHSQEAEMQVNASPVTPCEILHIDHFGPLEKRKTVLNILVVVDAFTRFTWLFPVKFTGTKKTIRHLEFLILLRVFLRTRATNALAHSLAGTLAHKGFKRTQTLLITFNRRSLSDLRLSTTHPAILCSKQQRSD